MVGVAWVANLPYLRAIRLRRRPWLVRLAGTHVPFWYPRGEGPMPSAADPVDRPGLRGYAIQMMCFAIERVPRTGPASTPDPATARTAVAGSA